MEFEKVFENLECYGERVSLTVPGTVGTAEEVLKLAECIKNEMKQEAVALDISGKLYLV